jgi:uncharacterized membrane-anchored protein
MNLKTRTYLCYIITATSALITIACMILSHFYPFNIQIMLTAIIFGSIFLCCSWFGHRIFDIPVIEIEMPKWSE